MKEFSFSWLEGLLLFARQKRKVIIWFLIGSAVLLFLPQEYLKLAYLNELPGYLNIFVGLLFVASSSLLITDFFMWTGNSFLIYQEKRHRKRLLNELNNLKSEIENGFTSVDEVVRWSHKVTPLLEFDSSCLENFKRNVFTIKHAGDKIEIFVQVQKFMALTLNEAVEKFKKVHNDRVHPAHPNSSSNDHI